MGICQYEASSAYLIPVIRNVGGPLGIRAALITGVAGSPNLMNEIQAIQRDAAQILIGTPAKVLEAMTVRGGLDGMGVRTLIVSVDCRKIARPADPL